MNNLIKKADFLKKEADSIVKESNIVNILSHLGDVHFVGGYYLNVIYRLDIDINVLSGCPDRDKALKVTNKLLKQGYFQTVGFADWKTFPKRGLPKGFYWELLVTKHKNSWKIDIWYLKPEEDHSVEATEKFKSLLDKNPSKRIEILKLKRKYFNGTKYVGKATGFDIYTKILEK